MNGFPKTEKSRLLTIAMMKLSTNPMVLPFSVKVRKFSLQYNLGGYVPLKAAPTAKLSMFEAMLRKKASRTCATGASSLHPTAHLRVAR